MSRMENMISRCLCSISFRIQYYVTSCVTKELLDLNWARVEEVKNVSLTCNNYKSLQKL